MFEVKRLAGRNAPERDQATLCRKRRRPKPLLGALSLPQSLGQAIGSAVMSGFLFACPFRAVRSTKTGKVFRGEQAIGQAGGEKESEGEVPSPLQASGLGSIFQTRIGDL